MIAGRRGVRHGLRRLVAERLTAQLLAGAPAKRPGGASPSALLRRAGPGRSRGPGCAVRARTQGLSAGDVDRALTHDRSLLITWLNRGDAVTSCRSEDYPWLQALHGAAAAAPPTRAGSPRKVSTPTAAERGVAAVKRALAAEGPLTRASLGERIAAAGGRAREGQALIHILALACLRGLAVRGPMVGGEHAYVLVRDWLGEPAPVDRERALAELARRYLAGHGPADDRDLGKWAGLPLRDARAGLEAIASELAERADGLVDLAAPPLAGGAAPAAPARRRSTRCFSAGHPASRCSAPTSG